MSIHGISLQQFQNDNNNLECAGKAEILTNKYLENKIAIWVTFYLKMNHVNIDH